MTDRDHFAAAALTGLVNTHAVYHKEPPGLATMAFAMADAMLRERSRAGQNSSEGTGSDAKCTERDSANHDAAPAARASVESVAPQPTAGDRAGNPPSHSGTGDTPKPISGCVSDRPKPINGPDPDSRVWETPVHTPAPHATHGEGSVRREGTEPVAWAVAGDYGEYAVALFADKESAQTEADRRALVGFRPDYVVVPLYRSPTLTDAEREAVERGYCSLLGVEDMSAECTRWDAEAAAILRGLLERLGQEPRIYVSSNTTPD